ncbi:multiple epidermal growth factor-like domains protein 11 isoform X2 [Mya arenaria]|uniref:multiple epidermal growth factor-like domains protein 11 isoform X2 n=1 Tax=Mya arenaria TaxID=6604 RepID=UPI0022E19723|nr:multiple epidermal growth factor-like domains protein 11 isoform X2 [Mya arenaria]
MPYSVLTILVLLNFTLGLCQANVGCSNCLYGLSEHCVQEGEEFSCLFGCMPGWVGDTCNRTCSRSSCKECIINGGLEECTRCYAGQYGPLCNIPCNTNCKGFSSMDDTCDFYGNCLFGCKPFWEGPRCDHHNCTIERCNHCRISTYKNKECYQCHEGYYWDSEREVCTACSSNCLNGANDCNTQTGDCTHCRSGYFGNRCDKQCTIMNCLNCSSSTKCKVCQSGFYPAQNRAVCNSCDDRHCIGTCSQSTGDCPEGCEAGWYGKDFFCNLECKVNNCAQCALGFMNTELCVRCNPGYYVNDGGCTICPENCKDNLCYELKSTCKNGCKAGYYGDNCQWECNSGCDNGECDPDTGNCVCKYGWFSDRCDRLCPNYCSSDTCASYNVTAGCASCEPGRYGRVCELKCSSNCSPKGYISNNYIYCNKVNGSCDGPCQNGFYGHNCSTTCPGGCGGSCDQDTGMCISGCEIHNYGKLCHLCPKNCVRSQLAYKRTCDMDTGECFLGCAAGFYGPLCSITCDANKHCKDNKCDDSGKCELECEQSGICVGDCPAGFFGPKCDKKCSSTCTGGVCSKELGSCVYGCLDVVMYGTQCDKLCPVTCVNQSCDRKTGHCITCGIGKYGSICTDDCLPGWWGEGCRETCGHCKDSNPCNIINGNCPLSAGCEVGWTGAKCLQGSQRSHQMNTAERSNLAIALGVSVSVVLVIIVLVAIFYWWRRKSHEKTSHNEPEPAVVSTTTIEAMGSGLDEPGSGDSDRDSARSDTKLLAEETSGLRVTSGSSLRESHHHRLYEGQVLVGGTFHDCCVRITHLGEVESKSKEVWRRLMNETEIQRLSCSHSNVVQLLQTYQNRSIFCVAFDVCMRNSLHDFLLAMPPGRKGNRDIVIPLTKICVDIAAALSHLHSLHVLHRQLRPCHVYMTGAGEAKLGDFYWAKLVSGTDTQTVEEFVVEGGKMRLAPETLLNSHYTDKTDIWGLGLICWEVMSVGKVPYAGLDEQTYRQTVLDGSRPPMCAYMHMYMYCVLKSCWQYYPDDRPNAEQVLNQLLDVQGRVSESKETALEKERRHGQPLNSRQLPTSKEDVSVILNPKFGARYANKQFPLYENQHSIKAEACDQDTFSTKHTGIPSANPGATGRPSARPKASYQELHRMIRESHLPSKTQPSIITQPPRPSSTNHPDPASPNLQDPASPKYPDPASPNYPTSTNHPDPASPNC